MLTRRSTREKRILLTLASLVILQLTHGVFQKLVLEEDFRSFMGRYPAVLNDFRGTVERYIETRDHDRDLFQPSPINFNHTHIRFLQKANATEALSLGLLIIVKSAWQNRKKRNSIRSTWGNSRYLQKASLSADLPTTVAFIVGLPKRGVTLLPDETKYGDIIQADFQDSYRNNTRKTLVSLRYTVELVKTFKYLMIVDDDMYIDLVNVVNFIAKIPSTVVQVTRSSESGAKAQYLERNFNTGAEHHERLSLKDVPLVLGDLRVDHRPNRNLIGPNSIWSVALKEYPFDYFPPFIAGGATLFDKTAATLIYYGSLFTQQLWLDDVYLGLIAFKMGMILTKTERINCKHGSIFETMSPAKFDTMMAIHGLQCPEQLEKLWRTRDPQGLKECSILK